MTKLIIIRHGESLGNQAGIFLGHTNLDLSPKGKMHAELARDYFKNFKIDAVYSSDLLRAYNTAKPTADYFGLEIIASQNLREIYAGDWEGKTYAEIQERYKNEWNVWLNDIGACITNNGESVKELADRVCNEVLEIAKKNDEKTVLIATHATAIRCLMTRFAGKTLSEMKDTPWTQNASINFAEYNDDVLHFTKTNITEHLGNLVTAFPENV